MVTRQSLLVIAPSVDVRGCAHAIKLKAGSLYEGVAEAIKKQGSSFRTDGFRPIKVLIYEPKKEYEVELNEMMKWATGNLRAKLSRRGRLKRFSD